MPDQLGVEIGVSPIGELQLTIRCPHCGKTGYTEYDRAAALRLLAEIESEIRKAQPGKPA